MARHVLDAGCALPACEAVKPIFRGDGLARARGLSALWRSGWASCKEAPLIRAQAVPRTLGLGPCLSLCLCHLVLGWPLPLPLRGWEPSLPSFPVPFPMPFLGASVVAARS